MVSTSITTSRRVAAAERAWHASMATQQRADCGTLVLDGRGVIVRCSDAARRMFGGKLCDLEGNAIFAFVTDLTPSDTSPSYNARYMAYLSTEGNWHSFQAVDVFGQRFGLEIAMSRMSADDHDLLLLNLRLPATQ